MKKAGNSNKPERELHINICEWMRSEYPGVIFRSGHDGIRLRPRQYVELHKTNEPSRGFPDLLILEPGINSCGLAIELKRDYGCLYKKNGSFRKSGHIDRQRAVLEKLRSKGFFTAFCCGEDECKTLITEYLSYRV